MHPQLPTEPPKLPATTSGLAITSLVCGITSFAIPVLLSLIAIISGHWSRTSIRKSAGRIQGKGMALAGLICGYTSLALVTGTITLIVYQYNQAKNIKKEEMAAEVKRGKELHNLILQYETDHQKFPETLNELVEKGYIGSIDHLQPVQGGNWIYFKGLTSKSSQWKYVIRSPHHNVVIYIDGTHGDRNLSYTFEPIDSPMRGHTSIQE